jgi:hypothetical protein
VAVYGDGYAIAGYRARYGPFLSIEEVRNALTYVERDDGDRDGVTEPDTPEEHMEIETKFAKIRPYVTIDSWHDTDQVGYGKFEQITYVNPGDPLSGAKELTDRNATWNVRRNPATGGGDVPPENVIDGVHYLGELHGCRVAIVNGVGQSQIKTIWANTIDTIILSNSQYPGSQMVVPPNHDSSYIIISRDSRSDTNWQEELKLYSRHPLSIHRAPVNVNTATDKVLVACLLGLQTNWGAAGWSTNTLRDDDRNAYFVGLAESQCPSKISLGRDNYNALLKSNWTCPNDVTFRGADASQRKFGHRPHDAFCFFCSHGRLNETAYGSKPRHVNEAHYLAWQILKEREQTVEEDEGRGSGGRGKEPNGNGPFKGWDDLYFRVFRPFETGSKAKEQLNVEPQRWVTSVVRRGTMGLPPGRDLRVKAHRGLAKLCMANFNSNTDILKFQPNIEWIDRWGANFTELYCPHPDYLDEDKTVNGKEVGGNIKLRVRPGELLDKTDLNIGTTEFTFDSAGIYEVESIGRIYDEGGVVAERKFTALIRVYDVWRESTQREFVCGTISDAPGPPRRSSDWMNYLSTLNRLKTSGQIALDQVEYFPKPHEPQSADGSLRVETGSPTFKTLCTYPEPVVPHNTRVGLGPIGSPFAKEADLVMPRRLGAGAKIKVLPAGYDGQILLANNTYQRASAPDPDVSFHASYTGDVDADFAGNQEMNWTGNPQEQARNEKGEPPLDEVGLLGEVDSLAFDLEPTPGPNNEVIEGEGRGGDLRPDGLFLGFTGRDTLDGSVEYGAPQNVNSVEGAITMWIKPQWHHGTIMRASLPVNYLMPRGQKLQLNEVPYEKGSTVCMPDYSDYWQHQDKLRDKRKWPATHQRYNSLASRDAVGYVRERFEHEFFNLTTAGAGAGAKTFMMRKSGDWHNSMGDLDWDGGGWVNHITNNSQSSPVGALHTEIEGEGGSSTEMATFIPGWLYPDSRPWYQMCPFRWFFAGMTWSMQPDGRQPDGKTIGGTTPPGDQGTGYWYGRADDVKGPDEGGICKNNENHKAYGQPLEQAIMDGIPFVTRSGYPANYDQDWIPVPQGGPYPIPFGSHKGRTRHSNFWHTMISRPFIDTMRTWGRVPQPKFCTDALDNSMTDPTHPFGRLFRDPAGRVRTDWDFLRNRYDTRTYDLEDWAYESYGTMYHAWSGSTWPLGTPNRTEFGCNKVRVKGQHFYQRLYSGTYATIDEMKCHAKWDTGHPAGVTVRPHEVKNHLKGQEQFAWPYKQRRIGRYYFGRGEFTSQTLYLSESSQGYAFVTEEEGAEEIELGTVRWTVFTPFYCVDDTNEIMRMEGGSEWRFPYNEYFSDDTGEKRHNRRYSPYEIKHPDHKGTRVPRSFWAEMNREKTRSRYSPQRGCQVQILCGASNRPSNETYVDPENWQQVLYSGVRHATSWPNELRYKVIFDLSVKEKDLKSGILLDSPVFDDITITYMRRPKVLQWREVAE